MINERELRIGNLVRYRDEKDCIVSNLGNNGFETVNTYNGLPNGSSDLFEYNPIPLTEEWLLKMGFYEVEETEVFDKEIDGERYISINIKSKKCFVGAYVDWTSIKFPEYVHQLQNLYFALTGQELEFK